MNQRFPFPCPDLSPSVMTFIKYTVPFAMIDPPNNSDCFMDSHTSVNSPGKQILLCSSQMWTRENLESRTLVHMRSLGMSRCSTSSHWSNLWAGRIILCAHTKTCFTLLGDLFVRSLHAVLFFMWCSLPAWMNYNSRWTVIYSQAHWTLTFLSMMNSIQDSVPKQVCYNIIAG